MIQLRFALLTALAVVLMTTGLTAAGPGNSPSEFTGSEPIQPLPWVKTDLPAYLPGSAVGIGGGNFWPAEPLTLQVVSAGGVSSKSYGTITLTTDGNGSFRSTWSMPSEVILGETLMVSAAGQSSGVSAESYFLAAPSINLDQLQNGTNSSSPQWANGNINSTNSCYSEGNSVPYRYFVTGLGAVTQHYFTIRMEWTKGGVHSFDYITEYDLTEAIPIASAGGPCGPPSPPAGCVSPTGTFPLPDFTDSTNYTGTIPSDFFTLVNPSFVLDGPGNLRFYNATVDSIGKMYFGGSVSDRELNIPVYFTTVAAGDVGFFWGGHLASGIPSAWGIGNGSASVGGAPYHMKVVSFDGGGGANQDRSIQNGSVCLPPDATITCSGPSTLCEDSTYSCSAPSGAEDYTWTVTGGSIVSGQGTNSITYTVTAIAGGTVTVSLEACNNSTSCPGDFCCSTDQVQFSVQTCNICPVVACHTDTSVYLCAPGQVCIPGFSCTDANGNLVSCTVTGGTLSNDTVCFNATTSGVYSLTLIATDGDGCADTCRTNVTVTINQPPVASCHNDTTLFVCDLSQICLSGFNATDPDGNLKAKTVTGGTLSGSTVCFTPVEGANVIQLIAEDSCGVKDTCVTTVAVVLNRPPVATCPGDQNLFLCSLSPVCIPGFSVSDPDGNIVSTTVSLGTLSAGSVCFTPTVGPNTIRLITTDACGKADTCETVVTVTLNAAPDIALGADFDTALCAPAQICVTYSVSDPNGLNKLVESLVSGPPGASIDTLNNKVCFTPSASGSYSVTVKVTDSCGLFDQDTQTIDVTMNRAPVATCHVDTSLFVCNLSQICLNGFGASDPDGNLKSVTVTGGTLNSGTVCFTPVAGVNVIRVIAEDSCGIKDTCETNVTVTLNQPPVATCRNDTTVFVCNLDQICLSGFGATDPNNNLQTITVTGGTYSNGTVCFTPSVGTMTIRLIAIDSCGAADTCETDVTIALNSPPVATCPGDQTIFVCNLNPICIDGFSCSDADGNGTGSSVSLGTLTGTQVCFTPVIGANTIELICTDACGKADTCTTIITVVMNTPPDIALSADKDTFMCVLGPICVPYTVTDPDNNVILEELVSPPAGATIDTLANTVCFTPAAAGSYTITVKVTDLCGSSDQDSQGIIVRLNQPPVIALGNDTTISLCQPQGLCFPYTVSDPDGLTGVIESLVSGPTGTSINTGSNEVCFTPTASGTYALIVKATDPCGAFDQDTINVTINLNAPPVLAFGPDRNFKLCAPQQLCEIYTLTDPDGLTGVTETLLSGPAGAVLDPVTNSVCFTPNASGTYTIIVKATDPCGASDQDTVNVTVTINQPPSIVLTPKTSAFELCLGIDTTICLSYAISDPDGVKLVESLVGGTATIDTANNTLCLPPNAAGTYTLIVRVTDSCGAFDQDTATIVVNRVLCCPSVTIEKVHNVLQGLFTCVDITMQGNPFVMGGFDLLIAYDASALTPQNVMQGSLLTDCGWEYFNYTLGANGNCAGACPSGLLRIVGIAETNNGANHPICLGPTNADTVQVAEVCFLVSNDRTLECQFTPIRFFWIDCGDNSFSTLNGDTLILSDEVYDYDNLIPINNGAVGFPTYYGAQDFCLNPIQPDKPAGLRCIDFYNGGIDIVCADSIDARGDINLNNVSNEIADAVLFSRYFVYGLSVFTINQAGQIAASDVNADGLTLTVADLVYLVRVITGQASPYYKLDPVATTYHVFSGIMSVETEMGAALVVVKGNAAPQLLANNMEIMSSYDGNITRILVYPSPDAGQIETFKGDFLQFQGDLISVEFGSSQGARVDAKLVPATFALAQNHPNPFNPSTVIEYTLPAQSHVRIAIYDLLGREIRVLVDAMQSAGRQQVIWDGRDATGNLVGSGVYFYRMSTDGFNSTRKMMLLK